MPSGVTSDIYEGKDVTPQEFMERVGRSMMYFIHQRGEDWNNPLRYPATPGFDGSTYHEKELDRIVAEQDAWQAMSEEERYAAWSDYYREQKVKQAEKVADDAALRARYTAMIAEVEKFDVSNEPLMESTKENALTYLRDSLDFDCSDEPGKWYEPVDYVKWCNEHDFNRDIAYHNKKILEEDERNKQRREYIDAFVRVFGVKVEPAA